MSGLEAEGEEEGEDSGRRGREVGDERAQKGGMAGEEEETPPCCTCRSERSRFTAISYLRSRVR